MNENELQAFVTWLQMNGCDILKPTSQWEKLRYRHPKAGVCIIHVNKTGRENIPTLVGGHIRNFQNLKSGNPENAPPKAKRKTGSAKQKLAQRINSRDGDSCCFCGERPTDDNPLTIEHWLPISKGGGNGIANLGLAHKQCNALAGNLSISEKVFLRDTMIASKRASEDFSVGFFHMGAAA